MGKSNKLMKTPLSTELFKRYGDINSLRILVRCNKNEYIEDIKAELDEIIEKFQKEKIHFINTFTSDLLNINKNSLNDNSKNNYNYEKFLNYTNFVLNLMSSCEKHLIDLSELLLLKDINDKAACILKCYTELKSISRKILNALGCKEIDFNETMERMGIKGTKKEEYLKIKEFTIYLNNLTQFYKVYEEFYNYICRIGDYIIIF